MSEEQGGSVCFPNRDCDLTDFSESRTQDPQKTEEISRFQQRNPYDVRGHLGADLVISEGC